MTQPVPRSAVRPAAVAAAACLGAACLAAASACSTVVNGTSPARAPDAPAARIEAQRVQVDGLSDDVLLRFSASRAPAVETRVNAPVARAYAALGAAFFEVGLPPTRSDSTRHTIGAINLPAAGLIETSTLARYVSCGSGSLAEGPLGEYRVRLTLLSRVTEEGSGSVVSTQLFAVGQPPSGTSGNRGDVRGQSSGRLEGALARAVQKGLAGAGAPPR